MAFEPKYRGPHPLVRTYFAIFTSAVMAMVLCAVIFEALGVAGPYVTAAIQLSALAACLVFAAATQTSEPADFFAAGRRVPPFFVAIGVQVTTFGVTGLLGSLGLAFHLGPDGLVLAGGVLLGLAFAAIVFAPFLRKSGAYSVAGFFAQRFMSPSLGVIAGLVVFVPVFGLVVAELRTLGWLAQLIAPSLGLPPTIASYAAPVLAIVAIGMAASGGLRALTWSQAALGIIAGMGLLAVSIIVSILLTNVPIPQLSFGALGDDLATLEQRAGLPAMLPDSLEINIPPVAPMGLSQSLQTFTSGLSGLDGLIALIVVALGVAGLPSLLQRAGTNHTAPDSRRTMGWALIMAAVLVLTIAAYAVMTKTLFIETFLGAGRDNLPDWLSGLIAGGGMRIGSGGADRVLWSTDVAVARDAVGLLLPYLANLPAAVVAVCAMGFILVGLGAVAAHGFAAATLLGDDAVRPLTAVRLASPMRAHLVRGVLAAVVIAAAWLATMGVFDPLRLALFSLAGIAATVAPVLALAIFWRRTTKYGAGLGLMAGLAMAGYGAFGAGVGIAQLFDLDRLDLALAGAPLALVVCMAASLIYRPQSEEIDDVIDDIRWPGGEIAYDRTMRFSRTRR